MSASVCSQRSRIDVMSMCQSVAPRKSRCGSTTSLDLDDTVDSITMAKRRAVSRALFDCPDSRTDDYARNKLKEIQAADSRKYNFDFDREVPLQGRWKWQPFVPVELSPSASSSSSVPKTPRTLPKTTIAIAPLISFTPMEEEEIASSLLIVRDVDTRQVTAGPTAEDQQSHPPMASSANFDDVLEESQESQNPSISCPSPPPPPIIVQSTLELPQGSTLRCKLERPRCSTTKLKPKPKQPKLENYFKVIKRHRTTVGKKKPSS